MQKYLDISILKIHYYFQVSIIEMIFLNDLSILLSKSVKLSCANVIEISKTSYQHNYIIVSIIRC